MNNFRSRAEIIKSFMQEAGGVKVDALIVLEVLLDIRELLERLEERT